MSSPMVVQVVVDKPIAQGFDYLWDAEKLGLEPRIGQLVEVPFGRSNLVGLVIKVSAHSYYEISKLKNVSQISPLPPLDAATLRLMNFASQYYIHGLGETVIPSIPQMWKKPSNWKKMVEKQNLAEILALGAIKYSDLSKNRVSDYIFSFDNVCGSLGINPEYLRVGLARYILKSKNKKKGVEAFPVWKRIRRPRKR